MSKKEFEGNTLDEAIGAAAKRLGVGEDDLDFHILETGRKGILGFGQRNVKISVDLPEMGQDQAPRQNRGRRPRPNNPRGPKGGQGQRSPRGTKANAPQNPRQIDGSELVPAAQEEGGNNRRPRRRRKPAGAQGSGGQQGPRGNRQGRLSQQADQPRRRRPPQNRPSQPRPRRPPRPEGPPAEVMQEHPQRAIVEEAARELINYIGYDWNVKTKGIKGGVCVDLNGEGIDALTDHNAELLLALQFILNRMSRRRWEEIPRIIVTCDEHRSQRDQEIVELAKEVAEQVRNTGKAKKLHDMNPYERRLVHVMVQDFEDLTTTSVGRGFLKKVRIAPARKNQPEEVTASAASSGSNQGSDGNEPPHPVNEFD